MGVSYFLPSLALAIAMVPGQVANVIPSGFSWSFIEELKTDSTKRGRQSVATLKVPGVDSLPAGSSYSSNIVTVTGTGVTFTDWDFTGKKITINIGADVTLITECTFDLGYTFWGISVLGRCREISWCSFDGGTGINAGVAIQGSSSGEGAEHIHHNEFLNLSSDSIKPSGTTSYGEQLIELNYFGEPRAFQNARANWSSGTTYAIDDVAMRVSDGDTWLSKTAGNLNNPIPASGTASNTDWSWVDPHADAIQLAQGIPGGLRIRWNYFEHQSTDFNGGVTTAIFLDPLNTNGMSDIAYVYENIIDNTNQSSFASNSRPLIISAAETTWFAPRIYNNRLREPTGGNIMTPSTVKPTNWGTNWEFDGTTVVAWNDSRIASSGITDWTGSTPALGADWP